MESRILELVGAGSVNELEQRKSGYVSIIFFVRIALVDNIFGGGERSSRCESGIVYFFVRIG